MDMDYFVNTKTGELQILWDWDEKHETNDYKKVWENRDVWRKITVEEYDFYRLVGERYMEEQEFLNHSDY
jgi:hypothetical protein